MKRLLILPVLILLVLGLTPGVASSGPGGGKGRGGGQGPGATVYQVDLDALNGSGVESKAVLILRGDNLRVIIRAKGLEPGKVHPQHIHGQPMGNATCPPPEAATRIDGEPAEAQDPSEFISIGEGFFFYGGVLLSLTPFPVANPAGVVTYSESFQVNGDLLDLSDEVIVLHGMTLSGDYVPALPVACGEIN